MVYIPYIFLSLLQLLFWTPTSSQIHNFLYFVLFITIIVIGVCVCLCVVCVYVNLCLDVLHSNFLQDKAFYPREKLIKTQDVLKGRDPFCPAGKLLKI